MNRRAKLVNDIIRTARDRSSESYEEWVGAIIDATLDEAAKHVKTMKSPSSDWIAEEILTMRSGNE